MKIFPLAAIRYVVYNFNILLTLAYILDVHTSMNIFAACSISSGAEMYSFIHSDQFTCISGLQFGISKDTAIMKFTTDNA